MRVLVTGAKGMLGRHMAQACAGHELFPADRGDFDLADAAAVDAAVAKFRPDAVIHCAAVVAVDMAEADRTDPAWRSNAAGSAVLARACNRHGARLVAISTDYVFDGNLDRPYHEFDAPNPRTVYGQSKLAGENAVRALCPDHLICRIAWLYGAGGPSFLHAMLKAGADAGAAEPVRVVNDQIGNPTSAAVVAERVAGLLDIPVGGTMHLTCSGEATWHDFAKAIFEEYGLPRALVPCTTAEFPRPAPRPANSRLEKRMIRLLGLPEMPDWRDALRDFRRRFPNG